jgi:hypothetical protein
MDSVPIYAFFVHLVSVLTLCTIWIFRDKPWPIAISFFLASVVISFCVSLFDLSDYEVYALIFGQIDPGLPFLDSWKSTPFEIGYFALNYFGHSFLDSFDSMRVGLIFIILIFKIVFLVKWGKFYFVSFLFYLSFVWYADSYLLRSSVAASILLVAFWALFDRRPAYQFFVPILIASTFHISALILIPFWWLRDMKVSQKLGFSLLSSIIILGFFGLGHLIINGVAGILSVDIVLVERLVDYGDSEYGKSAGILRVSVLIYVLITFVYIYFKDILVRRIYGYDLILCTLLFSLFLLLGFSDFEILSDRLFRLTGFFFAIAIGQIFYCLREKEQPLCLAVAVGFFNVFPYFLPGAVPFLD